MRPSRRSVLAGFLTLPAAWPALAAGQTAPRLNPTPACGDGGDAPTIAQTEGPYFSPGSPLKHDFAADAPGERITLAGFALTTRCRPASRALVELWHADAAGAYDNDGFRLRGHVFADDRGRWWFDTIVPGLYPGRTRHYHLNVQRPGGRVLTTQLYFPGEPRNAADGIFDPRLLMQVGPAADGRFARYDFVLL